MQILQQKGFLVISYIFIPIIIIINCKTNIKKQNEVILTKKETIYVKAICSILIVLHHLSQRIGINIITLPYIEVGKYSVAMFLFISGYGLMKSLKNNNKYLSNFIVNRVFTIYMPFVIVNIIMILINWTGGFKYSFVNIIEYTLGIKLIDATMWFIIFIIASYFIFYIIFKFLDINKGRVAMLTINIIIFLIGCRFKLSEVFINSSFGFILGIYLAQYEKQFIKVVKNRYNIYLIMALVSFILGRIVSIIITKDKMLIDMIFANISAIGFIIFILILLMKIEFNNSILKLFGDVSFYIYLTHNKIITMIPNSNKSIFLSVLLFIVIIISSYILMNIINLINRQIKRC